MEKETLGVIKIVHCYARKDKGFLEELEQHLSALKHSGQITTWYDREILPGTNWKQEIDIRLLAADIVLLLISPNFISSNYCYSTEMQRILHLRKINRIHIIPIILRPVDWQGTPIGDIQVLPTDGKPITAWRNRDEAFQDIVRGIRKVIETHASGRNLLDKFSDIRSMQKIAKDYGVSDIFQDGAGRVLQILILLGLSLSPNRIDDAIDDEGNKYELKLINASLSTRAVDTHHHLDKNGIATYRTVKAFYIATYKGIDILEIWKVPPSILEPLFQQWEIRIEERDGQPLNNPKIPMIYVRTGELVYDVTSSSVFS